MFCPSRGAIKKVSAHGLIAMPLPFISSDKQKVLRKYTC